MAWHHHHIGTGRLNLIEFSPGVENTFFIIPVHQRTATATTTYLIVLVGVKVDPVFHTLIEYPTRFGKISVPETFLSLPTVITGIVIGRGTIDPCSVQLNTSILNIFDKKIENGNKPVFIKSFRIIFFKPRPGRQVSVASFRP